MRAGLTASPLSFEAATDNDDVLDERLDSDRKGLLAFFATPPQPPFNSLNTKEK